MDADQHNPPELEKSTRRVQPVGWLPPTRLIAVREYLLATTAIATITLACYPVRDILGYRAVSLVFLLAVAVLPLLVGVGPVLLAALVSALAWDFFFIPPSFTLDIAHPADLLMLVTYFAVATTSAVLVSRIRSNERTIRLREMRTAALYDLTRELAGIRSEDAIAKTALAHLRTMFGVPVAFYPSQIDGDFSGIADVDSTYHPGTDELHVASWAYWNEQRAGQGTDNHPVAGGTYYPVSGPRYPLGVVAVRWMHGAPTAEQESLLQAIIGQMSSCLEREQLHVIAQRARLHAESERLYAAIFNSISHELRTPLASILGAADAAADTSSQPGLQRELVQQIHDSALELHRLVEDLLDMSRLESGLLKPRLDWVDFRDVLQNSLAKTREELDGRPVDLQLQQDLPLVQLDHALMEQVVVNLLRNAARHTPPGSAVTIRAAWNDIALTLTVEDNGPGFPPEALPRLFEKFYRIPGAQSHGSGLGLSIARGFVEAHGGTIMATNRNGGGACLVVEIPSHAATVRESSHTHACPADDPGRR